jgi:hypothetical protein
MFKFVTIFFPVRQSGWYIAQQMNMFVDYSILRFFKFFFIRTTGLTSEPENVLPGSERNFIFFCYIL